MKPFVFLFLIYLAMSHFVIPNFVPSTDLFPFYNWNLFSFRSPVIERHFVRIKNLDGKEFQSNEPFVRSWEPFAGIRAKIVPDSVEALGQAIQRNASMEEIDLLRDQFERNAFKNFQTASYEVLWVKLHGIEFLKEGKTIENLRVSEFEFKK